MKTINEIKEKITGSITIKILVIGLLVLILLIPARMVKSLIMERQFTRNNVVREISNKWGNEQSITGPILTVPWTKYIEITRDGKVEVEKIEKNLYLLPESLDIKGDLQPEIRYRGVYKVIVYKSKLNFSGSFIIPDSLELGINNKDINWEKASLLIGIPDMRGIQNGLQINWNDNDYEVRPGMTSNVAGKSGVTANIPISCDEQLYNFSFNLDLNGSENLFFMPLGKTTDVHLSSTWDTPSFMGAFLPDNREVSEEGFKADWKILHLNRNYPQIWKENTFSINQSSFGVNLLFPVDEYQKSMRSAKYAIMFIVLTFIMFLLFELINKRRTHPIQYILVSAGLLLFYTLLISLSEHIGFNKAYLASSIGIIGLITMYSHNIFKKYSITAIMGICLSILYGFLFVILQLQDYSLLLGSIGLFIILGIIMFISRKIDWYGGLSINDKTV